MSGWKGKTRGSLLGYKIFVFLIKRSGLGAAYALLRVVAFYFVLFAPTATRSIYAYFRDIHHYGRSKAIWSVYRNFYVFGQTLLDRIAILSGAKTGFHYTFDGKEHLIGLREKNRGAILISAHLGNWEIAGFFLNDLDIQINIVMFEAERERIRNYLGQVMQNSKVNIIPVREDLSHIFLINQALRKKEIICMHGDRFVAGSRVTLVDFMGKKAFFPLGPFTIASRLKIPFTFVYAVKGRNNRYHLSATPVVDTPHRPEEILEQYIVSLERKVRRYPLQWFNYYNFWDRNLKGGIK